MLVRVFAFFLSFLCTAPDDYTAQIGTLVTFEPTQTSSTVTVVITVDNIPEDTESFSVSLSLPVMRIARVALGDVTEATVTITEIGKLRIPLDSLYCINLNLSHVHYVYVYSLTSLYYKSVPESGVCSGVYMTPFLQMIV